MGCVIIQFDWAAPAGVEIVLFLPLPSVKRGFLRRLGERGQDTVITVTELRISNKKCCHASGAVRGSGDSGGDGDAHQVRPVALVHASKRDRGGRRGVGGWRRHGGGGRAHGGGGKGLADGVRDRRHLELQTASVE